LDKPAFTTDVIVGFPGETDADFEATCRVAQEVGFAKIHVFSYSPRDGTPAASLPDRVPPAVVAARRERLLEMGNETVERYGRELVGREMSVMVEGEDPTRPGDSLGTSCRYVPVSFPGYAPADRGRLVSVRIVGSSEGTLHGAAFGHGRHSLPTL